MTRIVNGFSPSLIEHLAPAQHESNLASASLLVDRLQVFTALRNSILAPRYGVSFNAISHATELYDAAVYEHLDTKGIAVRELLMGLDGLQAREVDSAYRARAGHGVAEMLKRELSGKDLQEANATWLRSLNRESQLLNLNSSRDPGNEPLREALTSAHNCFIDYLYHCEEIQGSDAHYGATTAHSKGPKAFSEIARAIDKIEFLEKSLGSPTPGSRQLNSIKEILTAMQSGTYRDQSQDPNYVQTTNLPFQINPVDGRKFAKQLESTLDRL